MISHDPYFKNVVGVASNEKDLIPVDLIQEMICSFKMYKVLVIKISNTIIHK